MTKADDIKQLLADLNAFRDRCEEAEYTDTGDAWSMIDRLESALRKPSAENGLPEFGGSLGTPAPADFPKPPAENDAGVWFRENSAAQAALGRIRELIAFYDDEPHSDECGMGACARCVVDEFAARVTPPVDGWPMSDVTRQDGEGVTAFSVRRIQHEAWVEGHDSGCAVSPHPCWHHPSPFGDAATLPPASNQGASNA